MTAERRKTGLGTAGNAFCDQIGESVELLADFLGHPQDPSVGEKMAEIMDEMLRLKPEPALSDL